MYVGWVQDSDGSVILLDTYSTGEQQPTLDTDRGGYDNAYLINASQVVKTKSMSTNNFVWSSRRMVGQP